MLFDLQTLWAFNPIKYFAIASSNYRENTLEYVYAREHPFLFPSFRFIENLDHFSDPWS